MNRAHSEYERFCVSAVVGQLSSEEANDLGVHAESCSLCQNRLAELELVSCAYFMHHTGKAKKVKLPAGMQRRFQERAEGVGIPLRDTGSALLGTRVVSVALSILILTFATQVTWKALDQRMLDKGLNHPQTAAMRHRALVPGSARAAAGDSLTQEPFKAELGSKENCIRFRAASDALPKRSIKKGNGSSVMYPPTPRQQRGPEFSASGIPPSTPDAVRNFLTPGLRLPVRRTFELGSASTGSRLTARTP